MKIILTDDVKKIGKKGEVVNVKQGYFRNFILPNNLGVEAGENGKLFGSITNMDIKKALDKKNIEVDKKKIEKADIDSLGKYEVTIKLYQQISAKLKVNVEAE